MTDDGLPEGRVFLDSAAHAEEACATATFIRIQHLGHRAPETQERLGDVLALLYREAICFHGCRGGDHVGERIAARVVNHSLASYRLLTFGYYDESLALTRNIGEIANLLYLFFVSPERLDEWKNADNEVRRRTFSPVKVRLEIQTLGEPIPIDESRYSGLCEAAVHLGPHSQPQAYNQHNQPTLGAVIQDGGLVAALNELSGAVGVCSGALFRVLDLGERRQPLGQAAVRLLEAVGGLDLSALRRAFRGV